MDYSLLFAVEYTEEELANQREELHMSMAIKNSMGPNDTNAATNAFFNSVIAKRKKKSSFKMTNEQQSIQSEESPYKYRSSCGRFIYHLSIIDYLQDFNSDK